jgi:hypothetical protein
MTAYSDVTKRSRTRLCFAYGLTPRLPIATPGKCINETHEFGRLESHIESSRDLLPRVVFDHEIISPRVRNDRSSAPTPFPRMRFMRIYLTTTPRGDAVLVVDGEPDQPIEAEDLAELLAATCFKRSDMRIDDLPILDWIAVMLKEIDLEGDGIQFGDDVHQCIFPGGMLQSKLHRYRDDVSVNRMVSKILYRGTVPVDSGSRLGVYVPSALNNPGSTFVAHGRGVSIFSGWTAHVENAFILTAASTVSALGALRLSRHEAFTTMALAQDAALASAHNARALVAKLSDRLNEMQLDLSFGVETHIDSILMPEMVVEAFQSSLSRAVGIRESLDNTSRMLQRVGIVISARQSKLEAGDRDRAERRDRLVAIFVAVGSLLALPPALLLAFFGISSPQVHPEDSIFDLRAYWGAYILAWLPFVLLVGIGGILYTRLRGRDRKLGT